MNDWLSKITSKYHKTVTVNDVILMARVIREQSELIKLLNDASVLHYIQGIRNLEAELEKAFGNLSPDTKELLK